MRRADYPALRLLTGLLIVAWGAALAPAASIDLGLNLLYTNPFNDAAGGMWEIAAKSDEFGIFGLQVALTGINTAGPAGPTGTVNGTDPAGFSEFDLHNYGSYKEMVVAQIPVTPFGAEQSLFYGVGTLANGAPNYSGAPGGSTSIGPELTTLTPPGISWAAAGDVFGDSAWDTAAVLLTGTFSPGQTPDFYVNAGYTNSGTVFTSVPASSTEIGTVALVDPTSTTVRDNLMTLPDYNRNGVVDAADYALWRDSYGSTTQFAADGSGNGTVDDADYELWKLHFGEIVPGAGAGATAALSGVAVPEPAGWVLGVGAAGVLFFGRFRGYGRRMWFP